MKPLISVIIPIYKVEAYLKQCVDSVLSQTYQNLEVILVNDGSPDNCPKICDDYAARDKRIKVIHKLNGGLSDARNAGLRIANGEYVLFLDSDDYWMGNDSIIELGKVLNNNDQVDIIYFDRITIFEKNPNTILEPKPFDLNKINGKDKTEVLSYFIGEGRFIVSACNKLIRKAVLLENSIFFEEDLLSEDVDWNFNLVLCAEHFFAINKPFYGYRKREGSITTTFGVKNAEDLISIIEKWAILLNSKNLDQKQKNLLLGYCTYLLGILMANLNVIKNKIYRKELKNRMLKLDYLFNYVVNHKTKKVKRIYRLFGFEITCLILWFYLILNNRGLKL